MGQQCSTACRHVVEADSIEGTRTESLDPVMYDLMRKSIAATTPKPIAASTKSSRKPLGQSHLLYKNQKPPESHPQQQESSPILKCPTRLLIRRRSLCVVEEGGGTHIYAIRYPEDTKEQVVSEQATSVAPAARQEQCPPRGKNHNRSAPVPLPLMEGADVFRNPAMVSHSRQELISWVTVSEEHNIYIADIGLTAAQCDHIIIKTEQVCRGQYAAYTYAKQTLGCREFPNLAQTCFGPVHTTVHGITQRFCSNRPLQLDDREPHIVKYDVTKKERQKLDMHTDKSEWTFLIAMSNGCGVDYEGGGTYFECLDATVHIQRGHALIFPGKLRHCGQKITSGLRFLLVGFLVDKSGAATSAGTKNNSSNATATKTPPSPPGIAPVRP